MPAGGDWKRLYDAAVEGDLDEVAHGLDLGIDPNYQHHEFGTTPLIGAAQAGRLDVVRLLVERGARADIRSQWDGHTAAEAAEAEEHTALARWLRAQGASG